MVFVDLGSAANAASCINFSKRWTSGGPLGYGVHTERWHYAEWKGGDGGEVLFDTDHDPHELTNLADRPEHAAAVAEMKALLKTAFGSMPERLTAAERAPAKPD